MPAIGSRGELKQRDSDHDEKKGTDK